MVAVRDSKDPDGPKLILDAAAWRALTHPDQDTRARPWLSPSGEPPTSPRPGVDTSSQRKTKGLSPRAPRPASSPGRGCPTGGTGRT
ncbi:MAG: DUF397 domain-containing protein [Actinomadura sp.]